MIEKTSKGQNSKLQVLCCQFLKYLLLTLIYLIFSDSLCFKNIPRQSSSGNFERRYFSWEMCIATSTIGRHKTSSLAILRHTRQHDITNERCSTSRSWNKRSEISSGRYFQFKLDSSFILASSGLGMINANRELDFSIHLFGSFSERFWPNFFFLGGAGVVKAGDLLHHIERGATQYIVMSSTSKNETRLPIFGASLDATMSRSTQKQIPTFVKEIILCLKNSTYIVKSSNYWIIHIRTSASCRQNIKLISNYPHDFKSESSLIIYQIWVLKEFSLICHSPS